MQITLTRVHARGEGNVRLLRSASGDERRKTPRPDYADRKREIIRRRPVFRRRAPAYGGQSNYNISHRFTARYQFYAIGA